MENSGVSPDGAGLSSLRDEAAGASSPKASIPDAVWLIWASQGEYSDRCEWPIAVALEQVTAETVTERLGQLWRRLYQIYKNREDELEEAGDWDGATLFATTPEGCEYTALTNGQISPYSGLSSCYADDRSFTCSEVGVLTAKGIEAATAGETRMRLDRRREPGARQGIRPN